MSELSSIPNPIPVVKPAVAEKVYDKQFCTNLMIEADPSAAWSAKIVGYAYDGTELEQSEVYIIKLEDLKALAVKDQELGQVLAGVVGIIGKYLVKCRSKGKLIVTSDNIEEILE